MADLPPEFLGPHLSDEMLTGQADWLRGALSSIGDAVVLTDIGGNVIFLNPAAQSATGWTQQEAAGKPLDSIFKIINEETRNSVENPATRALRDGFVVGLANGTVLIAKDGTERPIDDSAAPIRNAKGEIAGVVLVFRDVTNRRRQEHALRACLTRCENIIATLRQPFLILDKNLRVELANRAFYRTFQVSPKFTQHRLLFELGNGQWNIPKLRTLLEDVLPENRSFDDFEVEHDFPTIGRKIMLLNARQVRMDHESSESILLAIEDVTDRRLDEINLQASELRYRRLFETARDAILILNAETGKIIDANPSIREVLGYSHDELLDKELWQIGLFQNKEQSQAAFRRLQDQGYLRYDDLPLRTEAGQQVEVEFVSNLYLVDHQPIIQCNMRDITERRQLQRAKIAAEASADLHRRKDEFLAMLSHELRNPLAPIMNAVHLLGLVQSDDPLLEQAKSIIDRQVVQLKHLVDDLLEVSRITTGRVQLRLEQIDIRVVVNHAVETSRTICDSHKHELTVFQPPEAIWLYGDATRLEQVIVNLLVNAAKYTKEGGRIRLSVQQEGTEAVVRVRDTGIGIAPDVLPRIFDLFTQADRTLDRSLGGLGIGLTVVQRFVQMHGGRVEAHSSLGQGSEFVVRLPVFGTTATLPSRPATEAVSPTVLPLRVLVVDDNLDAAQSLTMLLRAAGHDVRTAHDGPTALTTALDFKPQVVLLDIGLPGLDGFEVAKRIRQLPDLRGVVLAAMTGYGQETDLQRSREAGFDHHLVKPVIFAKVKGILAAVSEMMTAQL